MSVSLLETLWRGWEAARLDPGLGTGAWWINHAAPHMWRLECALYRCGLALLERGDPFGRESVAQRLLGEVGDVLGDNRVRRLSHDRVDVERAEGVLHRRAHAVHDPEGALPHEIAGGLSATDRQYAHAPRLTHLRKGAAAPLGG
ncbi:DUF4913 domain-containing protein [Microbacterium sp. VKM Ac-2923]|uniref:DUF4913 domain-containing protein n=1 Tax=Microbacterium sp. VKM Ac-2923 TaxID=2929476 RepID=UPI0035AB7FB2